MDLMFIMTVMIATHPKTQATVMEMVYPFGTTAMMKTQTSGKWMKTVIMMGFRLKQIVTTKNQI